MCGRLLSHEIASLSVCKVLELGILSFVVREAGSDLRDHAGAHDVPLAATRHPARATVGQVNSLHMWERPCGPQTKT